MLACAADGYSATIAFPGMPRYNITMNWSAQQGSAKATPDPAQYSALQYCMVFSHAIQL